MKLQKPSENGPNWEFPLDILLAVYIRIILEEISFLFRLKDAAIA